MNTSDFVAKYVVCSEHLVALDKVAKFLGADETRLRRWLADSRCSDFRNNAFEQFGVKELIKKYRAEFFPEKPKEEEKAIKLNVDEVVKMLREEKTPSEMASTLGIPMDKFRFAYLKQLPEIQRAMGQPPKEEKAFDPISEDKTQILPR
jgi:hypothetical protein